MKRIAWLILFVFIISLFISGCSSDPKIDAWNCAQDAVKYRLKSPSTAKFPAYSASYVSDLGNNRYRISAHVDAQNSFGATIRQSFTVTLTLTESGYTDASVSIR